LASIELRPFGCRSSHTTSLRAIAEEVEERASKETSVTALAGIAAKRKS
jgi:hypothetical protein